jgi:alpha-tubulin suppressor-like RCC1 family protein
MDDHGSRATTCATLLLACFLAILPLASMTEADEQSAPAPNRVIEANRAGLARLTVELRAEGRKEPQTVEFKATDGTAVGGILLPEQRVEYTISAYDAQGGLTNRGSGTLPGARKDDRPLELPLPSPSGGETLVVSLTRSRIDLQVTRAPGKSGRLTVRARVFDPDGKPALLDPTSPYWGITDPRGFRRLPDPDRSKMTFVPRNTTPDGVVLCFPQTSVIFCKSATECRQVNVCADPYTAISAGGEHTCALTKSGVIRCWGSNLHGELGAPTTTSCPNSTGAKCSTRPIAVACPAGAPCVFKQVSAGQTLTAAIDMNYDAWWWGRGSTTHHRVTAVLAGQPVKFQLVAAGFGHACAISLNRNEVWCWGTNAYREAGGPSGTLEVSSATPLRVMAPLQFRRILAGGEHTCAIADTIVCWGRNDVGQVVGPNPTQIPPTTNNPFFFQQLAVNVSVVAAALSAHSTCIVTSLGQAQCWGTGYPIAGAIAPADRLAAGLGHLCSMTKQVVSCKGTGNWGEQGNGSTSFQTNPTPVLTPPAFYMDLSAGDSHACALTPDGDAFCWGRNLMGQVGNGTSSVTGVNRPTRVVDP